MVELDWGSIPGYAACGLVFCAFYMKAMGPLRAVAIASNVAFIAYGAAYALYPMLVLHAALQPLNCLRLLQLRRLIQRVRQASRREPTIDWLLPLMTRRTLRPFRE
jgi:CRP/FNR family transcriptional regulator, cyclic AMP receptor protein